MHPFRDALDSLYTRKRAQGTSNWARRSLFLSVPTSVDAGSQNFHIPTLYIERSMMALKEHISIAFDRTPEKYVREDSIVFASHMLNLERV